MSLQRNIDLSAAPNPNPPSKISLLYLSFIQHENIFP